MRRFVRYVRAKYEAWAEEYAYKVYISNTLQMLTQNTTARYGGSCYKLRFCDIINPPPEETRSGEEVKAMMLAKLKGAEHESP